MTKTDPFKDRSILCLNPRTFGASTDVEDLQAIHNHMSSMVLKNPYKDSEKAKLTIDGSSELLNNKENISNGNLQERRPALARKRAQFCLKPDTSQPSTTLEPSFQIDQLQDPVDFFAAYEKFENTKKEMKRQRGGEDLNEVKISNNARCRRPEISRRKVTYKHHDYSTDSKNAVLSSPEILQDGIRNSPTDDSDQAAVVSNHSQNEKLAGHVTKTKKRLNGIFDELISSDIHKLDGNEALYLLKDRFKIRAVDIDDLDLPDFHDVGRFDFVSLQKDLLEEQNRLSGTCTLPDGLISRTLGKQKEPSPSPHHPRSPPTPPRSPLLATSTFAKRLLNSSSMTDQSFICEIHSSLITSSNEITGGQLEHGGKDTEFPISGTLDLLAEDKVMSTTVGVVSPKMSTGVVVNSSQKSPNNKNHRSFGMRLAGAMTGLEDHEQCHMMEEKDLDDYTNIIIQSNEGSLTEGNAEDIVQKTASSTQANVNMEVTDNAQLHSIGDIEENELYTCLTIDLVKIQSEYMVANASSFEYQVEDGNQKAQSSMLLEVNTNVSKAENLKRNGSQPGREADVAITTSEIPNVEHENQKRKKRSRVAVDLADGIRRSQRVRSRPLEYWKGERFLYGRVDERLPTVIGVKYTNGKAGFEVQSFVSKKHKKLIRLVALH